MSYWMMLRRKRLIASSGLNIAKLAITYSAEDGMTDEIVTMADGKYRLLTLTKSGTLTIPKEVTADVWLCGGGAKGQSENGGGGGYVASYSGILPLSSVITVGAGNGGGSSFALVDSTLTANGGSGINGGSGGGGGGGAWVRGGTGAGVTTYPFGDTVYFANRAHSAGGGGGSYIKLDKQEYYGGTGGSNGGNGGETTHGVQGDMRGGYGGSYGGGIGGEIDYQNSRGEAGGSAYFYGGGGGGYAYFYSKYNDKTPGSGYQGVIYVRIPLKQTA